MRAMARLQPHLYNLIRRTTLYLYVPLRYFPYSEYCRVSFVALQRKSCRKVNAPRIANKYNGALGHFFFFIDILFPSDSDTAALVEKPVSVSTSPPQYDSSIPMTAYQPVSAAANSAVRLWTMLSRRVLCSVMQYCAWVLL